MTTDNNVRASGVEPGEILAGKYRIDRVLGAGGMGVVVAAHHVGLDERVAIKFLLPDALDNAEAVARFAREARAATKIKSPHVARVTDVGTLESGAPYMVMEYLEGQDLAAMVRDRGALPVADAAEFVVQACDAIAEAHSLGIVHRDLKPANLFCVRGADGLLSVKVLDFGISKVTTPDGFAMTKTAALMGSPFYMSPEQMTSAKNVDSRTDVWSMGVVLYELLAGRPPFQGETLPELCVKIANNAPEPIRNFRPDLPEGLERVVLRCLEKDRSARYQNVAELSADLVEFAPKRARASAERVSRIIQAAGLSQSAIALPPSTEPTGQPSGTVASWGSTGADPADRRGSRLKIAVASIGFVGLVVGGAIFALHTRAAPVAAAPAASESPAAAAPSDVGASVPTGREVVVAPLPAASAPATAGSEVKGAAPAPSQPAAQPVPMHQTAHPVVAASKPKPAAPNPKPAASAAATPAPAPTPPPAPAPNCNPPYTIGPNGNHIYKRECL